MVYIFMLIGLVWVLAVALMRPKPPADDSPGPYPPIGGGGNDETGRYTMWNEQQRCQRRGDDR